MKPFDLDPVLRYRKQKEDSARQRLFQAQKEEGRLMETLERRRQSLDGLYRSLEEERKNALHADRLLLYERRIAMEQEEIRTLTEKLAAQRRIIDRRRRRLLKASQERKALDKLKQRQNMAYRKYIDKKEAIMLDEIAVLKYKR